MINYEDTVEFVITPPEVFGIELAYTSRSRTTLGVFIQLVSKAKKHLLIASPFVTSYHGPGESSIRYALKAALGRNVKIDIITTGSGIVILRKAWEEFLPNKNICFYQPKLNIDNDKFLGSHAKCLISDGTSAYIGSANFTQPGLYSHLEIGVLIHGNTAIQLSSFWEYLIEHDFCVIDPKDQ